VLSISWFLVGAVAGISGALYPLWFSMDPNVGTIMLASVFAASVVGGIRSIYGTLAGGIVVAVTEIGGSVALSGVFGPVAWAYRAAFPILATCIVLLGMPEGLGGLFSRFRKRRKTA
jgi:branched-chain amino acid transport system permease protein